MTKIIRHPHYVAGGITERERELLRQHTDSWIRTAYRTERADLTKLAPAIEGLYAAAGLSRPRIVPGDYVRGIRQESVTPDTWRKVVD